MLNKGTAEKLSSCKDSSIVCARPSDSRNGKKAKRVYTSCLHLPYPQTYPLTWDLEQAISSVIVSVTKCSIVIDSRRAHILRNWRAITWVSNYSYPI